MRGRVINRLAHILIVEDDPTLQEAYSFILTSVGHDTTSAYNGDKGLKHAKKNSYDIILLDLHMPVMDGLEFLKAYKPAHSPSTKIIVFSNMIEPEINRKAMELGAYRCVLKSSMTPMTMVSLITELMNEATS